MGREGAAAAALAWGPGEGRRGRRDGAKVVRDEQRRRPAADGGAPRTICGRFPGPPRTWNVLPAVHACPPLPTGARRTRRLPAFQARETSCPVHPSALPTRAPRAPDPPEHLAGGANTPQSKAARVAAPHLAHTKSMWVTSGRTGVMRTTVPRSVTSLPAPGAGGNRGTAHEAAAPMQQAERAGGE